MKKIFTLLVLFSLFVDVKAQGFMWAKRAGLWAYDYGYGVAADATGNVYVAGKYEMEAQFDGTTVTYAGNHDAYLAKYSAGGDLVWVRTGGGQGGDYARAVTTDAAGYIYVAGEVAENATFGSFFLPGNLGADNAYVAKYSPNGDIIWIKSFGGWNREDARSIAVDAAGNVYFCGAFRGEAYFGKDTLHGTDIDDVYVAKLDAAGNLVWVRAIGGPEDDTVRGIAADADGNVYVTGGFKGTVSFGSQSLTSVSVFRDMYIVKYNTGGGLVWAKQVSGEWDEIGWAVTTDNNGGLYVAGEFNYNASIHPLTLEGSGNVDAFVAKYDPATGDALWAKKFGGNMIDKARGIASDGSKVYITGQYASSVIHGNDTLVAADSSDIFIAAFTASAGSPAWALAVSGKADAYEEMGFEAGTDVSVSNGYVLVTGAYLDGDKFTDHYLGPWTRTDMFIAKIDPDMQVSTPEAELLANVSVYPNPARGRIKLNCQDAASSIDNISIIDGLGKEVFTEQVQGSEANLSREIDLTPFGTGIYLLRVSTPAGSTVKKIIIN